MRFVWVFAAGTRPASAVFEERSTAEEWIRKHSLSGLLSKYPLNESVYDWSIKAGLFLPERPNTFTPKYIAEFSSAYQEHYHYCDGVLDS